MSNTTETKAYFERKADAYDLVDEQVYWRLSDELLVELLDRYVLPAVPQGGRMLDAGGGTGRWSDRILGARTDLSGVLYDLSPDMAKHAAAKAESGGYTDRFEVINDDLAVVEKHLEPESFDLVISFHNVLGFVADVPAVLTSLGKLLKPGGQAVLVVPNRYHAVFFNIFAGNLDEAESAALSSTARFTPDMPTMHMFTPQELAGTLAGAGLPVVQMTGFPVAVYPGFQETQLEGTSDTVQGVFGPEGNYERIKRIERRLMGEPGLAERGNNLFVVARKPQF